jgi:hypothetical protein
VPAEFSKEVFGPLGALALAIAVIVALVRAIQKLWEEHLQACRDDRDQRDKALAQVDQTAGLLKLALEDNKAMADVWERSTKAMADAWDRRTKADDARKRRGDG